MKKSLFLALVSIFILVGCKKEKQESSPASLVGKWTQDSSAQKYYDNGNLVLNVRNPGIGVVYDFQSNGNLVITVPGSTQATPTPYSIKPYSKVDLNGIIWEIRSLTNSNSILFKKDIVSSHEYVELFIYLKR